MKFRILLVPALAVLTTLMMSGCGSSTNREADRIERLYRYMVSTIENEDINGVMSLYSPGFLENGYNKTDVRNIYLDFFAAYHNIDENITVRDIDISGNYAAVEIREWWQARDQNGTLVYVDPAIFVDYWKYENGDWYLYGNQEYDISLKQAKPLRYGAGRPVKVK
ncbi:MAG: nuclear transport factor 2 family protein [Armatimonadetes bacterium]|jgi:ketosteroid isomerase-like protein|nr:nuclear transport factor 2 family protein [Armatimonadota bacterium]HOC31618.1 hypothetical protein [Armatimonadota bacterium]